MKFLIYFEISLLLLQLCDRKVSGADDDEDCYVATFTDWVEGGTTVYRVANHVLKTSTDDIVFSQNYTNVESLAVTTTKYLYFDVYLNESTSLLIVKSNEDILNIDDDFQQQSSSKSFSIAVTLTCSDGNERNVAFLIYIDDVNTHEPEFSASSYEFNLPMPMPAKIDLIQFGDIIAASDKDFSNTDITFSSDLAGITFTSEYDEDTLLYMLSMSFSVYTKYTTSTTFTLTATDSGTPSLSSAVNVTFNIDEENSEYTPSFTQPSFIYYYDPDNITISAENEEVTIENAKDGIECEISGDYSSYFDEPVFNSPIIEIKLLSKLPQNITILKVTLGCSIPDNIEGYADVVISIPEKKVYFSENSYTAKYLIDEDVHTISMTDMITIEDNTEDVVIEVEDTYANYFEVEKNATDSNEWVLSKKNDLTSEYLTGSSLNVMISVKLSGRSISDKASILLILPNGQTGVSFAASYFTGQYIFDENDKGELTMDSTIALNSKYVDVSSCSITGDYADNFVISYEEPSTFNITTTGDLPKDALKIGTIPLTLHIEFTLGTITQTAESTLLLYLSESSTTSTTISTTTEPTTETPTSTTTSPTDTTIKSTTALTTEIPTTTTTFPTDTTMKSTTELTTETPTNITTTSPTDTTTKATTELTNETPISTTKITTTSPIDTTTKSTVTTSSTHASTEPSTSITKQTTEFTVVPTTTEKSRNQDDCEYTVWLIVTILLCLTLVLYVGASLLFYFKKIRNSNNDLEFSSQVEKVEHFQKKMPNDEKKNKDLEFPVQEENVERNSKKKISYNKNFKDISTRRPTGFIRFNPDLDNRDGDDDSDNETEDNSNGNIAVNHASRNFKDISTRRPTGFIRFNPDLDNMDGDDDSDNETEDNSNGNIAVNHASRHIKDIATRRPTGFIRFNPDVDKGDVRDSDSDGKTETEKNTNANKKIDPPPPPPLPINESKKLSVVGKTVGFQEPLTKMELGSMTLADELKKAVKERESRLI